MKRWLRIISLVMSAFLLSANLHAISARAANLDGANATKLANAIILTEQQRYQRQGRDYFKTLANGRVIFIKGFRVTNLNPPVHGQLLDSSATVTADNGASWEVPVIWVDQNGNMLKIALEVSGVIACYPIIAFYLPEGYAMASGNNVAYDIYLPDFMTDLMAKTGVATLTNPASGVTYFTPLLPGKNKIEANPTPQYYAYDEEETESEPADTDDAAKPYVPDQPQPSGGNGGGGGGKKPGQKNDYENYNPKLSDDDKDKLLVHCDDKSKSTIQEDDLTWFVSFIKEVIEPEATELLEQKFPAYKDAAKAGELGKNLGLYVYYEDSWKSSDSGDSGNSGDSGDAGDSENTGKTSNSSQVAYVRWEENAGGGGSYVLAVNASYFFELDTKTEKYVFDGDKAYSLLDNTLVHEMMHVHMYDYTRPGMTGTQYNMKTGNYSEGEGTEFPTWFSEGIATAVDNPYQYMNSIFKENYGYDKTNDKYDKDALISSYSSDSSMKLDYSDGDKTKSAYASGYLANIYLSYLAAIKYDKKDAVKDKNGTVTIDSKVILSGMNHILEDLHSGKTLDQIISDISPIDKENGQHYSSTADFTSKFIASSIEYESDGGASAEFCAKLLSYFEQYSSEDGIVNGSVLLDFTNTQSYQLTTDLLKGKKSVYVLSDDQKPEASTVDPKNAQKSGGTSTTGTVAEEGSSEGSSVEPSVDNEAAKPAVETGKQGNDDTSVTEESEPQDNASEGSTIDQTPENEDDKEKPEKPEQPSEKTPEKAEEAASESSSDEVVEEDPEETAEFPEEVPEVEPQPEPSDDNEAPAASEEQTDEPAVEQQPEPVQDTEVAPQPEPDPAPEEDYTPPSMIISESEPEPAPKEETPQDNNQEVLDAVKPDNQSNEDSVPSEAGNE